MAPRILLKSSAIYGVVILIGLLLLGNVYLIYENSQVIERNRASYETAENVKINTADILRNLHLLDMLLRSYALTKTERFLQDADSTFIDKDTIFNSIEGPLLLQGYPMEHFYAMKDSVNAYYEIVRSMRDDLLHGREQNFLSVLNADPGYRTWIIYREFSNSINAFEDEIAMKAEENYALALRNSYLLQLVLFLITMPTLAYTAFYAVKTVRVAELLRQKTEENNKILIDQNARLDKMVAERTIEILAQNEEISAFNEEVSAQNEEIAAHNEQLLAQQQEIEIQQRTLEEHNEQLLQAQEMIQQQNMEIRHKNEELLQEVEHQTKDLRETNLELIEHNSRLEQFAFIISHNLRAPVARLVGLSTILEHASSPEEHRKIIRLMVKSTFELDQVIQDLGLILRIQKLSAQTLSLVSLNKVVQKVVDMLETEIKETHASITRNFPDIEIYSLPQYFESIIYNLFSNAIKYRHPDRAPHITINAVVESEFIRIEIEDNGLGIDLEHNRNNLFNLYKRFHFHVEGKGLGLYLVKTQIAALGGRIEVYSEIDSGTKFVLYFKSQMH